MLLARGHETITFLGLPFSHVSLLFQTFFKRGISYSRAFPSVRVLGEAWLDLLKSISLFWYHVVDGTSKDFAGLFVSLSWEYRIAHLDKSLVQSQLIKTY